MVARKVTWMCLAVCLGNAAGTEYWVSGSGDDSARGNQPSPWRTIQAGVNRLKPGDVLTVMPGRYPEHIVLRLSGTDTDPIVIRAKEKGQVILEGGSVFGRNCSHLRVEGFTIADTRGDRPAMEFTGVGESVFLLNNEIRGLVSRNAAALRVGGRMRGFVIKGNHVHHNNTGNQEAIRVHENTRDFRVEYNEVNDNTNIGIDIVGWSQFGKPRDGLVSRNFVHNNGSQAPWSSGIYLDGPDAIVVEYNISTGHDFGFQFGCEPSDDSSQGNILRFNIAYDNREYGLGIGGYTGGTVHHCLIHNNVFVNNRRELGFSKNAGHHHRIVNNIFYNPTGQSINFLARPGETVIDYNCYFTGYGETPGAHSVSENPRFIDLSNRVFGVHPESPCVDVGMKVPGNLPAFGGKRSRLPDMGAFAAGK